MGRKNRWEGSSFSDIREETSEGGDVVRDARGSKAQIVRPVDTFFDNVVPNDVSYVWKRDGVTVDWTSVSIGDKFDVLRYTVPSGSVFVLTHLLFSCIVFVGIISGPFMYAPDDFGLLGFSFKTFRDGGRPWQVETTSGAGIDRLNHNVLDLFGDNSVVVVGEGGVLEVVFEVSRAVLTGMPDDFFAEAEIAGRLVPVERWERVSV